MLYRNQFEIDVRICSGKPVIRGTRILVTSILSQLAAGESFDSIRVGFPGALVCHYPTILTFKTNTPMSTNPPDRVRRRARTGWR